MVRECSHRRLLCVDLIFDWKGIFWFAVEAIEGPKLTETREKAN
jgi:hypothetical protein